MNNWSSSIDSLLDKIRLNSIQLSNKHIQNHLYYKNASVYFEIPTIVFSVFSGLMIYSFFCYVINIFIFFYTYILSICIDGCFNCCP